MNIFQTFTEKPWLHSDPASMATDNQLTGVSSRPMANSKSLPLTIFLIIISVFFSLFIITFLARSQYPDFQALAGDIWQPFYKPTLLWINSAYLFAASICMQVSLNSVKRESFKIATCAFVGAILFSLQFIIAQLLLWQQLNMLGFYLASNPANSYFYVFTALHGLHLSGGILVLILAGRDYLRHQSLSKFKSSLELCTR